MTARPGRKIRIPSTRTDRDQISKTQKNKKNIFFDTCYLPSESAVVLHCEHGCVALGIFLNGRIQLGRNDSFPECSHLPFPGGFENSLGSFGNSTEQALLYVISVIAPIYNIEDVILSGDTFKEHQDAVKRVNSELKSMQDPRLQNIRICYHPNDKSKSLNELIYLSFDSLVEVLESKMVKNTLDTLVSQIKYSG